MKKDRDNPILAWQGLTIPLQDDWRPLKIDGEFKKGSITVGNMDGPVFQLRWLRPSTTYDGANWIRNRCKATAGGQTSDNPPRPEGFDISEWIQGLAIRQESEKTVWWGYSKTAGVLVEILLTNLCSREVNRWFVRHALPRLDVTPPTEDCEWSIYSCRFTVPPGYQLNRKRLAAGDLAFEFLGSAGKRIIIRQVFPALLALQRRPYQGWLRDRVFKEKRRFQKQRESMADDGLQLTWAGRKKIPFPFGFIAARQCVTEIIHDEDLDRLFIVESEWKKGQGVAPVMPILDSMRRSA